MSGHSKWSTIKHKKAVTDAARGKLFGKLSKAISIAVKTGGGPKPEANNKLRVAIEVARAANMPKGNIDRAVNKAASEGGNLVEIVYEGFGPGGFAVIAEVTTDNRNRAGQEVKTVFERSGGRLAGPGAVSFNFEPKGFFTIKKDKNLEEQMLKLIDIGVEDLEEVDEILEAYVSPNKLFELKKKITDLGYEVTSTQLIKNPKNLHKVDNSKKALIFLEKLNDLEDVQQVFANVDIVEK